MPTEHWTRPRPVSTTRRTWPGQAPAYKLGHLEILKLRQYAKDQLGARSDTRSFHDAVLEDGALPLDVPDNRVRDWVDKQK